MRIQNYVLEIPMSSNQRQIFFENFSRNFKNPNFQNILESRLGHPSWNFRIELDWSEIE